MAIGTDSTGDFGGNAIGANSYARGISASAYGQGSIANGETATAIGQGAQAGRAYDSGVTGYNAADKTTAIGQGALAHALGSTVIGQGVTDNAVANSVVVGQGASITAALVGSNIALGQGTVASRGSLTNYAAFGLSATQSSMGELALGNRQITNVAAGSQASDAATVGQLQSAIAAIPGGGVALFVANDPGAGTAPAATGTNAVAGGYNASATGAQSTAIGNAAQATSLNAVAVGSNALANAQNATAIGQGATASASGAVALGQGSVASVANTVSVGAIGNERKIVNVANGSIGTGSTDAITGGQLMTANQRVAAAFGGGAGVDGAGQLTAPSYTIQGNNYNNVGGALGALDTQVTTNTASIGTLNTNVAANTANIGTLNTQVASNTANIATNTTDIGTLRSQVNNGSIGLVQQDAATRAITVGKTTDGTVLDVSGTAGNRVITGVGAGAVSAISVDAVNGSQLYATNQNVAANTAAIASLSGIVTGLGAGGSPYLKSNSTGAAASAAGANANAIGSGASASGANSIALGTGSQATQSGSIAVGMNSASTGTNAIAIGTGATATGSVAVGAAASAANGGAAYGDGAVATASLSTAVGPNASATAANAVAIGSGSTNTVANTVSFGSAGNERRLTNVAAGINSTDAVNVGQLQSTASGFQSQIGGLQTQVIDNQREARRGIVAAVAVAPVLMPSAAGKTTVAFNTGFYRGESGVGIGVSHRLNFAVPTVVYGSYSNGGGVEHIGRAGMAVEF